jgi:hypothetical protein
MTTPPIDPATPGSGLSTSLTEPVPALSPAFAPPEPEPGPVVASEPAVRPVPTKRGSSGSSRILNIALGAAVLVAVAGVAFAVGRGTAPASSLAGRGATIVPGQGGVLVPGGGLPDASFDPNGSGFPGAGGQGGVRGDRGGFGGGLTITGTVDSVSAESITIKLESGQTVTVGLDGSTTYHQQADAAASDVTAGKTVQLQLSGGFRPGQGGNGNNGNNGNGNGTSATLGTAGSVTIVP